MVALSVAAVLAIFLLYVSIAGGRTPQLEPSQLPGHHERVMLVGKVVGPIRGSGYSPGGLRFKLADIDSKSKMMARVVYHGSVPDLFKLGRHVVVEGRAPESFGRPITFVAQRDSLVTKCPSKYSPKKT